MQHTRHVRELGCFGMIVSPCASRIRALTWGWDELREAALILRRSIQRAADGQAAGDIAPLKVASSTLTGRDLCCTIQPSLSVMPLGLAKESDCSRVGARSRFVRRIAAPSKSARGQSVYG